MVINTKKLAKLIVKQRKYLTTNFEKFMSDICNTDMAEQMAFYEDFEHQIELWEKRVDMVLKTFNKTNYLIRFHNPQNVKSLAHHYITEKLDYKAMAQLEILSEILKEEEKDNEPAIPKKHLYQIEYTANREILLNGKLLHRPRPDSPNENLISYLISHPNKVISLQEIEKDTGIENISVDIHQKIRDLGFTGDLKKIFFPQVDQQTIKFTNPITESYLTKNNLPRLSNVE